MSYTNEQEEWLVNQQADLDMALAEHKWSEALDVILTVNDAGYQHEARIMNESFKRAKIAAEDEKEWKWEPVEEEEIPFITPEEDDAPVPPIKDSDYATEWGDDGRLHTFKK